MGSLSSAMATALGKSGGFAECLGSSTRQSYATGIRLFAEWQLICRVSFSGVRQRSLLSAK
jgi:hypothetical protein